jgi:putative transposase
MRKVRAGKSASNKQTIDLLPERVTAEQMKPQPRVIQPSAPILAPDTSTAQKTERHRLVNNRNQTINRN